MIYSNLARIKIIKFCGNIPSICFNSSFLLEGFRKFKAPKCFSVYFSKAFPKAVYANLPCSVVCLWLEGNSSAPVRYSYLSVLPDGNADIFPASLLILYYSFSSLILSFVMISFLKHEVLSDARVASITKKNDFPKHFCTDS